MYITSYPWMLWWLQLDFTWSLRGDPNSVQRQPSAFGLVPGVGEGATERKTHQNKIHISEKVGDCWWMSLCQKISSGWFIFVDISRASKDLGFGCIWTIGRIKTYQKHRKGGIWKTRDCDFLWWKKIFKKSREGKYRYKPRSSGKGGWSWR